MHQRDIPNRFWYDFLQSLPSWDLSHWYWQQRAVSMRGMLCRHLPDGYRCTVCSGVLDMPCWELSELDWRECMPGLRPWNVRHARQQHSRHQLHPLCRRVVRRHAWERQLPVVPYWELFRPSRAVLVSKLCSWFLFCHLSGQDMLLLSGWAVLVSNHVHNVFVVCCRHV